MKYYQQGDVILTEISSVPTNARPQKSKILAEGEATGHRHEVIGNAETFLGGNNMFLVAYDDVEVQHQEHNPISLPAGTFAISIVREYDHFKEEARAVVD